MDRRQWRAAGCLSGGAEHPDHQRVAALYRRRHQHRRGLRHLGFHRLPHRRDHRHSAHRFHEPGGLAAPLSARQHGAVPLLLGVVWPCAQSLRDDRVSRAARLYRRRPDPARFHDRHDHAAALETGDRPGRICRQRNVRAGDRADDRRLPDRLLRLALGVLRQPRAWRGDARGALVYLAQEYASARSAAPGRLARHRADGGRSRGLPDRA
jgi:hypothetical protein